MFRQESGWQNGVMDLVGGMEITPRRPHGQETFLGECGVKSLKKSEWASEISQGEAELSIAKASTSPCKRVTNCRLLTR
jgi:hypothetical protein